MTNNHQTEPWLASNLHPGIHIVTTTQQVAEITYIEVLAGSKLRLHLRTNIDVMMEVLTTDEVQVLVY